MKHCRKTLLCALLLLCLTISSFLFPASAASYTLGDVNGDGSINASDALLCLQHSVALVTLTPDQTQAGDVNADYKVNASDALMILQYSVGLIHNFQHGAITSTETSLTLQPGGCAFVDIQSSPELLVCYYDGDYIRVEWEDELLPNGDNPLSISALNVTEDITTVVTVCYEEDESTYVDIEVHITGSGPAVYNCSPEVPDFGVLTRTAPTGTASDIIDSIQARSYFFAYDLSDISQNYGEVSPLEPYINLLERYGFSYSIPSFETDDLWFVKYGEGYETTVILGFASDTSFPYIDVYLVTQYY